MRPSANEERSRVTHLRERLPGHDNSCLVAKWRGIARSRIDRHNGVYGGLTPGLNRGASPILAPRRLQPLVRRRAHVLC